MLSTMQEGPLLISGILRHGQEVYGDSEVITVEPSGDRRATFAQVAERAEKLASALRRLGMGDGDRVGTFAWNDQEHLEAYLAVPSMGAVLHTLNIRLFPEQLGLCREPRRGQGGHLGRFGGAFVRQGARASATRSST